VRWIGTGQAPSAEASIVDPPAAAEPSSTASTAADESGTASDQSAQL
jgi:hypothetical protein